MHSLHLGGGHGRSARNTNNSCCIHFCNLIHAWLNTFVILYTPGSQPGYTSWPFVITGIRPYVRYHVIAVTSSPKAETIHDIRKQQLAWASRYWCTMRTGELGRRDKTGR